MSSLISYGLWDGVTLCSKSKPLGLLARVDVMGARSGLREFSSIASCRFCFLFSVAGGPSTNEINVQIRFKRLEVLFSNNNFSKQISLLLKPNFLKIAHLTTMNFNQA